MPANTYTVAPPISLAFVFAQIGCRTRAQEAAAEADLVAAGVPIYTIGKQRVVDHRAFYEFLDRKRIEAEYARLHEVRRK